MNLLRNIRNLFNLDEMSKNIINSISSNFYNKGVHEDIDTTEKNINECTDKFEEIRLY